MPEHTTISTVGICFIISSESKKNIKTSLPTIKFLIKGPDANQLFLFYLALYTCFIFRHLAVFVLYFLTRYLFNFLCNFLILASLLYCIFFTLLNRIMQCYTIQYISKVVLVIIENGAR